jgi:hypothetical protein
MVPSQRARSLGKRNLVVVSGKMGTMDDALGPIEPLSAQEVVSVLSSATFPWWISGGCSSPYQYPSDRQIEFVTGQ